jgi:SAM-dependent methyltransferase
MNNLQSEMYTEFDKDPTPITAFVAWLADIYHLSPGLRVLDLGCGPGRMLTEYHRLGWQVSGMEPDPDFYWNARETARSLPDVRVLQGGFTDLDFEDEFDLITAINNPFSYLLDVSERVDSLKRVYHALKPGGVFFLVLTNFLYKLQHFEPVIVQQKVVDGEKVIHLMENEIDFHEARWKLHDQYFLENGGDVIEKEHEQAMLTLPELLYLFQEQGFHDIRTYSSYKSRLAEAVTGEKILLAAQKPIR